MQNENKIKELERRIKELEREKEQLQKEQNRLHPDEKVNNYLQHSYSGTQLLRKHKLDEQGVWEVLGEDANCDLHGPHHQPSLGFFDGTLSKVLTIAVNHAKFYTWGGGGEIIKVLQPVITKVP